MSIANNKGAPKTPYENRLDTYDVYDVWEGTLLDGVSSDLTFTNVSKGKFGEVINDGTGNLRVRFNDLEYITVKRGESLPFSQLAVSSISIANSSGNPCDYRIKLVGE